MSKPLEIFLFKGCSAPRCNSAYAVLLKNVKAVGKGVTGSAVELRGREVNVVVSDGRAMRGMNKRFRGVDTATDVLAFPLDEVVLGEIWLCPSVISKNAKMFNQEFRVEIVRVLVHGILHLAGYDHKRSFVDQDGNKERMFVLQERVVNTIFEN